VKYDTTILIGLQS